MITKEDLSFEMQKIAKRLNLENIQGALYFPKYFQIETSRLCNAKCPYCAYDQWNKDVPFMSEDLFAKVVNELERYAHWIEWVCLSRAGEPLLDKKIIERVYMLKQVGIKRVNLTTNAFLLNEEKIRRLLDVGLDEIMFSIDSIDKNEYEKIKVGLKFEKVLKNIELFFKLREEVNAKTIVRIRAVAPYDIESAIGQSKLRKWEDYWNQFRKPNDRIYMKKPHNWGNQKELVGYVPNIAAVYHPCILPWSTLHVTAMGTATLCPMDYDAIMNLGSVVLQSIKEIWDGVEVNKIRENHRNGMRNNIRFCEGCKLFDLDSRLEFD